MPYILVYNNGILIDAVKLGNRFSIGRDVKSDLQILDPSVSRRQSTISLKNGNYILKDEGSSNGTFVNGLRVGKKTLTHLDVINVTPSLKLVYTLDELKISPVDKTVAFEFRSASDKKQDVPQFIFSSKKMLKVQEKILKIAATDIDVLITGETGVGKELAARLIHHNSKRRESAFLAINCSAFPDELLESELFGYEKGAFTGAVSRKTGLIEACNKGTLFLDEIADASSAVQAKLLRVIENKEVVRIGSTKGIKTDVRIISATNKNLKEAINDNMFRKDLFYRISSSVIEIPPLRERKDDIKITGEYFLNTSKNKRTSKNVTFDVDAVEILEKYNWPGNTRELRNVCENILINLRSETVTATDIPSYLVRSSFTPDFRQMPSWKELERDYLKYLMERYNSNKTEVAKQFGVDRKTLYRKLSEYGLHKK